MSESKKNVATTNKLTAQEEKELVENLDLLMNFEVAESETDWSQLEDLDVLDANDADNDLSPSSSEGAQ